ncbi:hypothetical protein GQ44DRAFT_380640 [Phaeosphaeriaceae sp. PMI808]|nr:hypothetical protein GQ44DRAFT_380640 [Phaeosphaeriaceae sp. PMI808]
MSLHRMDTIVFCGLIALHGFAGWLMSRSPASLVALVCLFLIRLLRLSTCLVSLSGPYPSHWWFSLECRYLHKIPRFPLYLISVLLRYMNCILGSERTHVMLRPQVWRLRERRNA